MSFDRVRALDPFSLFSTIATLGTPQDITLQELRVECFFPAGEATDTLARRVAADALGS
jgi:hypothetical protein